MGCGQSAISKLIGDFEHSTPMLVMPFTQFKEQGRIMRSVKKWREEALKKGWLVEFKRGEVAEFQGPHGGNGGKISKVAIFISHTWWDRDFKDPWIKDHYDVGAPDFQTGEKKDLKFRVICKGVEELIEKKFLFAQNVMIWVDWQSISQDDKEEKLKGVKSLIHYAAMCDYMLVPTEDMFEERGVATDPYRIRDYGKRAWCRIEYFVFSLLAEMQAREDEENPVQLYTILLFHPEIQRYVIQQYPKVQLGANVMPHGGALSNPDDMALIKALEDKIVDVYGHIIVEKMCKAAAKAKKGKEGPLVVDLSFKMLRPQHVDSLINACNKYKVDELYLQGNQLGRDGEFELVSRGLWRPR